MDEIDHSEWDRAWALADHREISDVSKLVTPIDGRFGKLLSASIAAAPIKFLARLYLPIDECAICSLTSVNTDRMAANLYLVFDSPAEVSASVWVHRSCFEELKEVSNITLIPW